ncbi:MAG: hypothetical protein HZA36_01475 [Parcubacteria group bacterium]|nr:hypothetical protein [Parcubacteria group bacterium]
MAEILLPPNYKDIKGPLIFLAGPIQDAPDWQHQAIQIIQEREVHHIASPRHPMVMKGDFPENLYNSQVEWEHHHLNYAGKYGVILFWLAKPISHTPGRAYAQTTRFELGWSVARSYLEGIKVVVGIEDGFSNARYIKKTISTIAPSIPICSNLEETCIKALQLIAPHQKHH